MKGDAIKAVVAKLGGPVEPTDEEALTAVEEGVDLLLGLFDNVKRIADAQERSFPPYGDNVAF